MVPLSNPIQPNFEPLASSSPKRSLEWSEDEFSDTDRDVTVWTRQQQSIFQILKENGTPLALAGDGRADSPGHSAKYGTYSLLDVNCKKIIITQLVAVSELVLLVIDIYIPIIYSPVKSRAVTIWRKKA